MAVHRICFPPPPPNFTSTDPVRKKSSSEDNSKNAPTISGSKFAEGNTESAAYPGTKGDTRGEKRVSTVHTDDECKIMDQEKNPLLSTRQDPTTRFKRQMQAFHKRAKQDIAKIASNKGQKTPSSEVQTREPEAAHNLSMTNNSKESQIHAAELARKGFRSDDITASNSRYTLKKNKALSHPNLSELGRRNVRMVRTNNFI